MLYSLLCVGFGGCIIGAIIRMFAIAFVNRTFSCSTNLETLFVNVIDSFIIRVVFSYIYNRADSILLKSFVSTGILGSFSAFSYDNLLLLQKGVFFIDVY